MSQRSKHRIVLQDFKAKKQEEGAIEIELPDGSVVEALAPALWPDEVQDCLKVNDAVGAATLVIGGEEQYAAFKAGGGSASILMVIIQDELGETVGKSSASSGS